MFYFRDEKSPNGTNRLRLGVTLAEFLYWLRQVMEEFLAIFFEAFFLFRLES